MKMKKSHNIPLIKYNNFILSLLKRIQQCIRRGISWINNAKTGLFCSSVVNSWYTTPKHCWTPKWTRCYGTPLHEKCFVWYFNSPNIDKSIDISIGLILVFYFAYPLKYPYTPTHPTHLANPPHTSIHLATPTLQCCIRSL